MSESQQQKETKVLSRATIRGRIIALVVFMVARKILKEEKLRIKVKDRAETVSRKVRKGEIEKIPYMLVVGDKERQIKSVRVRQRGKGDIGILKLEKFTKKVQREIEKRV